LPDGVGGAVAGAGAGTGAGAGRGLGAAGVILACLFLEP